MLLTTIRVYGQDSTFVNEFCNLLAETPATKDPSHKIAEMTERYMHRDSAFRLKTDQDLIRFQYNLATGLMKRCSHYGLDRVRLISKRVMDLESKLTASEIDSLTTISAEIEKKKSIYVYIVTVDDFYPDSTVTGICRSIP